MPGELRIRVRYQNFTTPWFDYMMASPKELLTITDGTGWFLERIITYPDSPIYFAVLQKDD